MNSRLQDQILSVLVAHSGLCMDVAEERELLADALVSALSTDLAEDHDGRVERVLTPRAVQSEAAR
jgi:hypothetical protein